MTEGIPPSGKKPKFDWEKERRDNAISEAVDAEIVGPLSPEVPPTVVQSISEQSPEVPATTTGAALAKALKKNGNWRPKKSVDTTVEKGKPRAVPPELAEIYGDKVPPGILEMYGKLKSPKKIESYVAKLRADKEREDKNGTPELTAQAAVAPEVPPTAGNVVPQVELEESKGDHVQEILDSDRTPKEWRERLRTLIRSEGEAESLGVGKISERLRAHLAERSKESAGEAKEYGPGIAEFIGSIPERYNKLDWRTKLAVTGVLMLGVSLTAVTLPVLSGAISAGLYGQRALAGIGLGINKRKALDAKIEAGKYGYGWLKGKSELTKNTYVAALTAVYMGGTTLAVYGGVEALNALGVGEWLNSAPKQIAPDAPLIPETPVSAAVPVADAEPASAPIPEAGAPAPIMPEVSIAASSGHGYEYMMKRLWEGLPEDLDANKFPEGSDIRRLLEADASSIDRVVHQIAADPSHGFYNADGTNVRIELGSRMTINADGNIQLGDAVKAPEGAPTTSAYYPEGTAVSDAPTPPVKESVATPSDSVLRDSEGNVVHDGEGNPVHTGTYEPLASETPVPVESATQPEVLGAGVPEAQTFFTKIDNIKINPEVPGIYEAQDALTGEKYLAAFGGNDEARFSLIQDYLMHPGNQGQSIRFAHEVSSLTGSQIKVDEIGAGTTSGHTSWFLDFFKKPISPPSPDTFLKRLSQ